MAAQTGVHGPEQGGVEYSFYLFVTYFKHTMNKKVIIGSIVVIGVIIIAGGYVFWKSIQTTTPKTPDTNETTKEVDLSFGKNTGSVTPNITKNPNPTQASEIILHTSTNEDVPMKDFYKAPDTRLLDQKGDAVLKEDRNYSIDYIAADQSFGISLTGESLQTSRNGAEQELLNILGITKDQSCKLNVSVTVPGNINESNHTEAWDEYGLSFCPNGKPLP